MCLAFPEYKAKLGRPYGSWSKARSLADRQLSARSAHTAALKAQGASTPGSAAQAAQQKAPRRPRAPSRQDHVL